MESTPSTRSVAQRIRSMRQARGWSLADVEELSSGRVKAATLGSYERGDRSISLERTIELADIFGVPLVHLVCAPEKAFAIKSSVAVMINLRRTRCLAENSNAENTAEIQTLSIFLMRIAGLRDDWNGEVMSLRQSDLDTIALMTFKSVNELLDWLAISKLLVTALSRP